MIFVCFSPPGARHSAVRMRGASPLVQRHLGGAFQHDFLSRGGAHFLLALVGSLLQGDILQMGVIRNETGVFSNV